MLGTLGEIAASAPAAFLIGLGVGWIVSQRYAIVRRNDEPGINRRRTDKGGSDG